MLVCVQLEVQHAEWPIFGRLTDLTAVLFPQTEARRGVLDAGQSGKRWYINHRNR